MPSIADLIAASFRRVHGQLMNFPEKEAGTPLPVPEPGRRYLLYLHVPFCVVLCPFCSFHRVRYNKPVTARYFESLRREIGIVTEAGYRFDEVYVGGGTPTVMPEELATTIRGLRETHPVTGISAETNPDDVTPRNVAMLRRAGVNRLSVGVQSFDDALLREMQRYEKYGSGEEIVRRLRDVGGSFDTINVDMIFNFPHQSEASLRRDLDILVDDIGVDQVSYYPLMVVGSTERKMTREMGRVDRSRERRLYSIIAERLTGAGYQRTSAWCFSREAGMFDEYIVERPEYLGLGSGSFSYLRGSLYASTFSINHYFRLIDGGKTGTVRRRELDERAQMRYYLLMRLFGGSLDLAGAETLFEGRFRRVLWPEITALRAIGAVRRSRGSLALTEYGQYLWVVLMREFFTGVNSLRDEMRHYIAEERAALPQCDTSRGDGASENTDSNDVSHTLVNDRARAERYPEQ